MAAQHRRARAFRGVSLRLGTLLLAGSVLGGGAMLHQRSATPAAVPIPDGKHLDRLAMLGGDDSVPVREARLYDTLAMFGLPQAEPRPWSVAPIVATAADAGIRSGASTGGTPRMILADQGRRPHARAPEAKVAATETRSPVTARATAADAGARAGLDLFGWEVPGTRNIPTRQDAARVAEKVGAKASDLGRGTAKVAGRAATALGDGLAGAGSAIATTFGWR